MRGTSLVRTSSTGSLVESGDAYTIGDKETKVAEETQDTGMTLEELVEENARLRGLVEENVQLREQTQLLQTLLLAQVRNQGAQVVEEGYIVVRSNITGYTSLEHPDIQYRGKNGDVVIPPFSQVPLSRDWLKSPTIPPATMKGIISVDEVDDMPTKVVTMPANPDWVDELPPEHRRIAWDIALHGDDADEGDVTSYPRSAMLFMTEVLRTEADRVNAREMQDVVLPVVRLAAWYERNWRDRSWVMALLEEKVVSIQSLTRLGV